MAGENFWELTFHLVGHELGYLGVVVEVEIEAGGLEFQGSAGLFRLIDQGCHGRINVVSGPSYLQDLP